MSSTGGKFYSGKDEENGDDVGSGRSVSETAEIKLPFKNEVVAELTQGPSPK